MGPLRARALDRARRRALSANRALACALELATRCAARALVDDVRPGMRQLLEVSEELEFTRQQLEEKQDELEESR